jgi:hypothetical protein
VVTGLISGVVTGITTGRFDLALRAGLIAGVTAAAFYEVGNITNEMQGLQADAPHVNPQFGTDAWAFNVAAHAYVGCGQGLASGGGCGPSALAGAATSAAGPVVARLGFVGGLMATAALGGAVAVIGGGKFANGAETAAFGYLYNNAARCMLPGGATLPECSATGVEGVMVPRGGGYPSPPSVAAEQLAKNRAAGAAYEEAVGAELEQSGVAVGQQITVETQSGVRTRLDYLTRDPSTGEMSCIECKASATAPLTPNQTQAFPEIGQSGATIVGAGKPGFSGGMQIPPTDVQIRRGP